MTRGLKPQRRRMFDAVVWTGATMFLLMLGLHEAQAGDHRYDLGDPRYRAECGSCHLAYPPQLLAAQHWRTLLDGLERHFGVDASIDAADRAAITPWLAARAGRDRGVADPAAPRISSTRWFRKEHREVDRAFRDGRVKSAADCGACHRGAEQGDFDDDAIVLPAPVTTRR